MQILYLSPHSSTWLLSALYYIIFDLQLNGPLLNWACSISVPTVSFVMKYISFAFSLNCATDGRLCKYAEQSHTVTVYQTKIIISDTERNDSLHLE